MHLHVDDFDTDADVAWSLHMSDAHSELSEISKLLFWTGHIRNLMKLLMLFE